MAIEIKVAGDTLKFDTAFISGKERVFVNGKLAFKGKFRTGEPKKFESQGRSYRIERRIVSEATGAKTFDVRVHQEGNLVASGFFDQFGERVANEEEARKKSANNRGAVVLGALGSFFGMWTMMAVSRATEGFFPVGVPAGALLGAIGAGVGFAMGYAMGRAFYNEDR